ncbi:hypothetical protein [Bradyrhizobium forestalis]|uniref:hypothetical protein n=1 Tax=Bradyrhizobium forestalis TaxID=1419263 RepID=UPI00130470E0|nr:hypothetical protein [Bradyrhizobium forestalis]
MKQAIIRWVEHFVERGALNLVKGFHESITAEDVDACAAGKLVDRYYHRDGLDLLGWRQVAGTY